jgi:hypothetical protein
MYTIYYYSYIHYAFYYKNKQANKPGLTEPDNAKCKPNLESPLHRFRERGEKGVPIFTLTSRSLDLASTSVIPLFSKFS